LIFEPCLALRVLHLQEKRKRGLYRDELGTLQVNIQAAEVRLIVPARSLIWLRSAAFWQ
jgi:hypothetical protein